jgi:flagellar basal body rod protein FlgB
MTTVVTQDRNRNAAEYLRLLVALREEMDKAMGAIANNALTQFEDSIACQQLLSARLVVLADELSVPLSTDSAPPAPIDDHLMHQIFTAGDSLAKAESNLCRSPSSLQPVHGLDGVPFCFGQRTISGGFWPQVEISNLVLPDVTPMGGLNTSLLIGVQALDANQGALDATSNNIANVNTPGYTREVAQFSENGENQSGDEVTGGGVTLTGLQSIRDELLNIQIQQQTSLQSSANTQSSSLQQIQTSFTTSGDDIASALDRVLQQPGAVVRNPGSAPRSKACSPAARILPMPSIPPPRPDQRAIGCGPASAADGAQINSLTAADRAVERAACAGAGGEDGGTTQDQLDQLVQQLVRVDGISITQSSDGETITTGNGTPLVSEDRASICRPRPAQTASSRCSIRTATTLRLSIQGGTLGGAITFATR